MLAVGTRLQDSPRSLGAVRGRGDAAISLNAGDDASKHLAAPLVADARRGLGELSDALGAWRAPAGAGARQGEYARWTDDLDETVGRTRRVGRPSSGRHQGGERLAGPNDYIVAAAGGLPAAEQALRSRGVGTFDCEYGFSCMGYEVGGAWGAAMAMPDRTVISFCGDGSYLMANSDVYGSVLSGHKFVLILCDNEGYAVIDRLQVFKGGASFNNMLADVRAKEPVRVDFVSHAGSMGAWTEQVDSIDGLEGALERARAADRTAVIVVRTDPHVWTGGDAWWDVGVPEVSERDEVLVAKSEHEAARSTKGPGVTTGPMSEGPGSKRRHPTIVDVENGLWSPSHSCRCDARGTERERREARRR